MTRLVLVTPEGRIVEAPTTPGEVIESAEPTLAQIAAREAEKFSTKKNINKES
jgi:hypothetical protein